MNYRKVPALLFTLAVCSGSAVPSAEVTIPEGTAAATHDVKIYFSKTSRSITHGIDPDIDKERTKVLNDMLFTGRVQAIVLIDRPSIPKDISNATGDHLKTDDKMAVLEFKAK